RQMRVTAYSAQESRGETRGAACASLYWKRERPNGRLPAGAARSGSRNSGPWATLASLWNADLMRQRDLLPLAGGWEDREAEFDGRQSPRAGMERRAAVQDRFRKLVDDLGAGEFWRRQRVEPALVIGVDHHPIRHRAQIGMLTGH